MKSLKMILKEFSAIYGNIWRHIQVQHPRKLTLCMLTLLGLLIWQVKIDLAILTNEQCDSINGNGSCMCRRREMEKAIYCSTADKGSNYFGALLTVNISIKFGNKVTIICRPGCDNDGQHHETLLQLLPHVAIGLPQLVIIDGCPAAAYGDTLARLQLQLNHSIIELRNSASCDVDLTRTQLAPLMSSYSLKLTGYTRLASDLFDDFGHLSYLEVQTSKSPLALIPAELLQPLTRLKALSLSGGLTKLPIGLLNRQRALLNIFLAGNALQNLSGTDFVDVPQLRTLYLSRNGLTTLRADVFTLLPALQRVYLEENRLRTVPPSLFEKQSQLKALDLSLNRLYALPSQLFAFTPALQELILSHNQLESLEPQIFATLNYLRKLYLDSNLLHTLASNIFAHQSDLELLDLRNNRLHVPSEELMCTTFGHLRNLGELLLRNNSLRYFCSKQSTGMHNRLDLAQNKLESLSSPLLVRLVCDWAHVNLSQNTLASIEVPLELPEMWKQDPLPCRSTIELNDNPLHCDCLLEGYASGAYRQLLTNATQLKGEQLRCATPPALQGRRVSELMPGELRCPMKAADCPRSCNCWTRLNDRSMLVNCTNAQLLALPALPLPSKYGLRTIELDVSHNNISALPDWNQTSRAMDVVSDGYGYVTRLHAASNQLRSLGAPQLPPHLSYLDVRDNQLQQLNESFFALLNTTQTLQTLWLAKNPWLCDCDAEQLLIAVKLHYRRIGDVEELLCATGPMFELAYTDVCPEDLTLLLVSVSLLCTGFLFSITAAFYYKFHMELKVWLYAHNMCLWCVTEAELDKDKRFDAFISYSHKDEQYVLRELLPGLESGPIPFRICTHERNWLAGAYIPEQIVESVEKSCRTILVMSQNFIESAWARMEFRTAHQCALNEGRARVIIIMYGELSDMSELDVELQAYLKMNTYLKWNDPNFWRKLRYALPHWNHPTHRRIVELNAPIYLHNGIELRTK